MQPLTIDEYCTRLIDPTPVEDIGTEEYLIRHIVPDKVSRFSWENHRALRGPVVDEFPEVVTRKGSQIGFSTSMIGFALGKCDTGTWDCIYFLPTDEMAGIFGSTRVDRLIGKSPHLTAVIRERQRLLSGRRNKDTMTIKQVRDGFFYLKGLVSAIGAISVPADMVLFDEVDDLNQDNMAFARDRIAHSRFGLRRYFGVGRHPGHGIDQLFTEQSDMRRWTYRCKACGEDDQLVEEIFPDNMRQDAQGHWHVGCRNCGVSLNRDNDARWVETAPGRPMHGYSIPSLVVPAISLDYVMKIFFESENKPSAMALFRSSVLALPDAGAGQPITEAVLERCEGSYHMLRSSPFSFLGVDVGNVCHITISRPASERGLEEYLHFEEVPQTALIQRCLELDEHFNFAIAVIDRKPSLTTATGLADALGRHRVYLQEWKGSIFDAETLYQPVPGVENLFLQVTMDRDTWLDRYVNRFTAEEPEVVLPVRGEEEHGLTMQKVWSHHKALQKVMETTSKGVLYVSYRKNVENHYAFAGAFAHAAQTIWFGKAGRFVGAGVKGGRLKL